MSRAAGDPVMGEESGLIEWKRTQPVFLVKSKLMSDARFDLGRVSASSCQVECFTLRGVATKSRTRVPSEEDSEVTMFFPKSRVNKLSTADISPDALQLVPPLDWEKRLRVCHSVL